MTKIRLTKEFSFESAHSLEGYDGGCREIHGHSYRLFVTVAGCPNSDSESPKYGMVIDFGDLRRIVASEVVDRLDHAFVMRQSAQSEEIVGRMKGFYSRVVLTPYQPTCENMLVDFAERIGARLPEGVELHSLKLHETATSFAEWYASDNI